MEAASSASSTVAVRPSDCIPWTAAAEAAASSRAVSSSVSPSGNMTVLTNSSNRSTPSAAAHRNAPQRTAPTVFVRAGETSFAMPTIPAGCFAVRSTGAAPSRQNRKKGRVNSTRSPAEKPVSWGTVKVNSPMIRLTNSTEKSCAPLIASCDFIWCFILYACSAMMFR